MVYCQHFSLQGDESLTFLATKLKFTRMLNLINFLQNTKLKVQRKKEKETWMGLDVEDITRWTSKQEDNKSSVQIVLPKASRWLAVTRGSSLN